MSEFQIDAARAGAQGPYLHGGCGCHRLLAADFTLPGAKAHYPPDLVLEPVHLDIDLRFDLEAQRLQGAVTHTIRARQAGERDLRLHAVDFEQVEVEGLDGHGVSARYDDREIAIRFDTPLEAEEERKFVVRYAVQQPATGMFFSKPDDTYPERAVYAATDHETERARHWLPTIDLPSCRPTLSFHLRGKQEHTLLANGRHEGEEQHDDGTKTVHWTLEQHCPSYLTCVVAGDLVEADDGEFEGIPLRYYTSHRYRPEDLKRSFGRTGEMLAWMTEKLGYAFPFPKYYQFALPGFGGAMENISLVAWDDVFVLDETLAKEWGWLVDQINVHEMAHSYFGDLIVCRDYAHAWLKESWATYMENLWLEDKRGRDEGHYDFFANISAYFMEADSAYMRPIMTREFNHSWQMYDRHLYPGGASRLHMLRKKLGDEIFFEGVRTYVQRFAHKTVETDDFRKTLEEVSGRSLGKWFDQWILGKGYPKVEANFSYDADKKEGKFTFEQKQVDKKAGIPVFEFAFDVLWSTKDGDERRRVELERSHHGFVFKMDAEPERIEIDPDGTAVMTVEFDPGADKLRQALTAGSSVITRIRAAQTLCKGGKPKDLRAVQAAYLEEPFWGVRLRMALAMGKVLSDTAVDTMATWIGHEQDGLVLEILFRACLGIRDARIRKALMARLDGGLDLYRARQAAFEVLGAQRDAAPYERLVEAAGTTDFYAFAQGGAMRGLAATRKREALDVLLGLLPYGATSNRARPTAASAIAMLGSVLDDNDKAKAGEALVDALRDPVDRVRWAAAAALGQLGWAGALSALAAYRGTLSDQEKVGVDRAIDAIRKAQKPAAKAAEKSMDDLRDEVRKLEGRLRDLEAAHESERTDA